MSPAPLPTGATTSLLYRDLNGRDPEMVVGASGSWLTLSDGRKVLDGCAGAAVASIGHGDVRVIEAVTKQLMKLSYHHTSRLTNPAAEGLAKILVGDKPGGLAHAIFLSSGSEANESAIKLARQYFVEIGQSDRINIVSRHHSYHGNSLGCVSLTGLVSRRKHFEPMLLKTTSRVSPCYPYRFRLKGETDVEYSQRLADELEAEFVRLGPHTVAAFFAETVGGAAAGNITAVPGYFKAIRKVCDKYGVLLILDEVMSGCGRTGKFHAWEWEGVVPDIETCGKGLNGGYQALSAVLLSETIYLGLKSGSGAFANGQTYQNHPAACAAALTVMQIFEEDQVVKNCAERGDQLFTALIAQLGDHPHVGEIRGRGLFLSLEFVLNKSTKETFPVDLPLAALLDDAMFERGVAVYSGFGKGTADGVRGDHILLSPPLTITAREIDILVKGVKEGVEAVFASPRLVGVLGKKTL